MASLKADVLQLVYVVLFLVREEIRMSFSSKFESEFIKR